MVDNAVFALRTAEKLEFFNYFRDGRGRGSNRTGAICTTQRPHSAHDHPRLLPWQQIDRVVEWDKGVSPKQHLTLFGEIEGHDGNIFPVYVLPHVYLRPIG